MLCEIPLIHLAVCEYLEWKTKPARRLAWMAFRVKSNLKYIFISLPEKDSQEISKVYSNAHWCYKYFFSRKKMLSTLFLTIYMGRGFYFKTTQTSLSDWLSLSYPQVLRKHNGEFPIFLFAEKNAFYIVSDYLHGQGFLFQNHTNEFIWLIKLKLPTSSS